MTKYTSISLPKKFIQKINEFIETHPEEGYSSVADFVKEASRSLLRDLSPKKQKTLVNNQEGKIKV